MNNPIAKKYLDESTHYSFYDFIYLEIAGRLDILTLMGGKIDDRKNLSEMQEMNEECKENLADGLKRLSI